ncbi:unnamed protein product [Prunus armeniaca]
MPPQTRRMAFPKVVIERETDSEQSSSEEDEAGVEQEEEEVLESENEGKVEEALDEKKKGKAPITISLKKVCKVCKKPGHEAGFKGATYIDCPMKPCFLCKMPGHTTVACPHRVATEYGVVPAPHKSTRNALEYMFERQIRPRVPPIKPAYVIPDQVSCAVIRYHSRRVTSLEFHPTKNNILLSGDKKGQLGVWDFVKVHEKIVYGNVHSCILNNMKFKPASDDTVYAASSDGTISCTDLETGISVSLMNLNPDGWQGKNSWRMLYGMDINAEKGAVLVADNFGFLYLVDTRSNDPTGKPILIHKKGSKVVGLHCNPVQPDLLLSCGNDHFVSLLIELIMVCLVVWLSLQPKYMRFLSVFSHMVKYVRLKVTWFLLLRLEYGTFVESKLVLPFMTFRTAVLLTLHIFLQYLAAKFLALHRTTVFVYGTPYLAIWIHQAERLYTVMTLIAI